MEIAGDSLIITDSRPGAKAEKVSLKGLEKNVYLACDEAPLEEELLDMFEQNGCDPQEVHDVLTRHIENSLILNMDGRYVSLALRHPVQPLSPYQDFPGGAVVPEVER